jgi:hypothetical protein
MERNAGNIALKKRTGKRFVVSILSDSLTSEQHLSHGILRNAEGFELSDKGQTLAYLLDLHVKPWTSRLSFSLAA